MGMAHFEMHPGPSLGERIALLAKDHGESPAVTK